MCWQLTNESHPGGVAAGAGTQSSAECQVRLATWSVAVRANGSCDLSSVGKNVLIDYQCLPQAWEGCV